MRNYKLDMSDYKYEREQPVLIATMIVSILLVVIMFIFSLPLGLGFLLGVVILMVSLYSAQMKMLGSCVRISETQFPHIYKVAQKAADRLDIDLPPVYILQSPEINAFATGFFGSYYVVLHSAILEACTDEELVFVIGHEFSHIKGNHVMINTLMNMSVGSGLKVFPVLSWLQTIMRFVFLYLGRCFEYTCDRGGLIASGEIKSFITCQTKLAVGKELFKNIDIMEFYNQALELDKKPFGFMGELEASHPLTVNRIRQAVRYYRSEKYRMVAAMQGKAGTGTLQGSLATGDLLQRILDKPDKTNNVQKVQKNINVINNSPTDILYTGLCPSCGSQRKGNAAFCTVCGIKYEKLNANVSAVTVNKEKVTPVKLEKDKSICKKCGNKNVEQASFCTSCGMKL